MTGKIGCPNGYVIQYSINKNNSFFKIIIKSIGVRSVVLISLLIVSLLQILAHSQKLPYLFFKDSTKGLTNIFDTVALSYISGCIIYFLTSVLKNWIWLYIHYKKYNKGQIYYNCNDILESFTWRLQTLLSNIKIDTNCIPYERDTKQTIWLYPPESLNNVTFDLWHPITLCKGSRIPFIIGLNIIVKEIKNFIEPLLFGNIILTRDQRIGFSILYESEIYEILEQYIQSERLCKTDLWDKLKTEQSTEIKTYLSEYIRGLYKALGITLKFESPECFK